MAHGPIDRLWHGVLARAFSHVPRPDDAPFARHPGAEPDRLLILGSGPAAGWGLRSHQLALPGQLAAELGPLTGAGVEVDAIADHAMTALTAIDAIADRLILRYDAIVVVLGVTDCLRLIRPATWRGRLGRLLAHLEANTADSTRIVVVGIPPISSIPSFAGSLFAWVADVHARRLDRVSRRLCRQSRRSSFVALPAAPHASPERHRSPEAYRYWARLIASHLAPRLLLAGTGRHWAHHAAVGELQRQRALDALAIVDTAPEARFDRIVATAQEMFGTRFAALTFIDGDREWFKSGRGFTVTQLPRSVSFCDHTIRRDDALVVADALAEPRFRDFPTTRATGGVRFYAGQPIHAPTGERIGALCVFDPAPRSADSVDLLLLRDLAALIERELWVRSATTSAV